MSKSKIYVGVKNLTHEHEIFHSDFTPTLDSHGNKYLYAIGPFRTLRGAKFMRDHGTNNPNCLSVADAERLAKADEQREKQIVALTIRLTTCPIEQFDNVQSQLLALKRTA